MFAPILLLLTPFTYAIFDAKFQELFTSHKDVFSSVRHALQKSSIIPDVLDDFTPQCFVAPYYGKHHRSVTLGNEIKPSKVQSPPSFKIYCPHLQDSADGKRNLNLNLTVVLTDPDAPSRSNPEWSEVCHWIGRVDVSKVDNHGEVDLSVRSGEVENVIEYKPPGPPPKTGFHRYVFVLLAGNNSNLTAPEERKNWGTGEKRHGVRRWAEEEDLEIVGANFFVSKNKVQK